jgi:hypothetical protein
MNLANILMLLVRQHAAHVSFPLMNETPPQLAPVRFSLTSLTGRDDFHTLLSLPMHSLFSKIPPRQLRTCSSLMFLYLYMRNNRRPTGSPSRSYRVSC